MTSNSDIISTKLVKLKIQAEAADVKEFKNRLSKLLEELDCGILINKPLYQNRNSNFFRSYIELGMNRRKTNGKEKR